MDSDSSEAFVLRITTRWVMRKQRAPQRAMDSDSSEASRDADDAADMHISRRAAAVAPSASGPLICPGGGGGGGGGAAAA